MPESRIERAGQSLYKEFIAREEFSLMVGPEAPADIEEAYSVQDVYMDLKARDAGGYAGYKIAYTTKVMQERLGAKEPVYGRILSDGVFNSPCKVKASDYVNIGVECEVAVTLGNDLLQSEAPFTRETVYGSVAHIALAFEIIDGRPSLGDASIPQSIATNISGAGVVIGDTVENWRALDIPGSVCELKLNGQSAGTARGEDVNGHPVEPMIWIANAVASRGKSLRKGDVVITGSMIPPIFIESGTLAVVEMDNLGTVSLDVG